MIDIDLSGRAALVTGGSRGIGRACVETLTDAGARVVFGYHDSSREAEVSAFLEERRRLGHEVDACRADLSTREGCRDLVDFAAEKLGGLQICVNNAGIWRRAPVEVMSDDELTAMIDTNLKSVFRVTHFATKLLHDSPSGGCIVQIASTAGERGEASYSHYAATKGAVNAMVKSLARELAPRIRVNVVSPGWVETEMTTHALSGAERTKIEREIPLGRVGEPEDIANAVAFLASDRARWITGATLRVNGGAVLGE